MIHHHHEKETHQLWRLNIFCLFISCWWFLIRVSILCQISSISPSTNKGLFFFFRTLFPSASYQTHHFWGFEYFLFTPTILEGLTWCFWVNFSSIHPHRGRFLEPHLSQGESLDKEFHRCVKVLLEPDKSLGDEEKSEETHKKRACVEKNAPFPRGGAQSL